MRPAWFTAASLTTTLPLRPPHLACQALEVYQHSATCPFYSYPFMRAENPTERLKELAVLLSGATGENDGAHQPAKEVHSLDNEPGHTPPSEQRTPPPSRHRKTKEQTPQTRQQERCLSPWSKSPTCRRLHVSTGSNANTNINTNNNAPSDSEFCAFTHASFNNNQGITVITTPDRLRLLSTLPPVTTDNGAAAAAAGGGGDPQPELETIKPYKPIQIPGKGIGLVATKPIRTGTRIMSATPAILVDDRAWKGIRAQEMGVLVAEGVAGLPDKERERVMGLSVKSGWQGGREYGVVAGNAFRVVIDLVGMLGGGEGLEFHGVFTEVSRLNHDCAPNLGYYFDSKTLSLKVYAVRDIFPGEELTISYVDVVQPHSTRQKSLSSAWSFTCTCPRCTLEPHLLGESDSRVKQMQELRRELDDYSGAAMPQTAELLVTLYELEGLQVRIYEAYYRAALEWNGVEDAARAVKYARLCLDKGLLLRGEDRPFVESMREMVRDAKGHWSWRFRVKERGL
ncbi:SET domain-containing protein 5 [Parachaetomium inaequale]|uniref:SET domain-containing protein 5 n=1 Tax=Parachaetomium inaequale TaxID=2588326 RepID=A0AAN6PGI7_9PEZI|nr:SET domain-containing protein 5 [Parachaetomium inaequale]